MLNWQFSELMKEPKQFTEDVDCQIVTKERFDILSIDSCHVDGMITFDGSKGKLELLIDISAQVLAANTGEPVTFSDELKVTEDFNLETEEYVDAVAGKINLCAYILILVDVMIPLYVNDESKHLTKTSDKHWELIDETTFLERVEANTSQSALSNLSNLVSKKSK